MSGRRVSPRAAPLGIVSFPGDPTRYGGVCGQPVGCFQPSFWTALLGPPITAFPTPTPYISAMGRAITVAGHKGLRLVSLVLFATFFVRVRVEPERIGTAAARSGRRSGGAGPSKSRGAWGLGPGPAGRGAAPRPGRVAIENRSGPEQTGASGLSGGVDIHIGSGRREHDRGGAAYLRRIRRCSGVGRRRLGIGRCRSLHARGASGSAGPRIDTDIEGADHDDGSQGL